MACALLTSAACGRLGFGAHTPASGEDAGSATDAGADSGGDDAATLTDGGATEDGGMVGTDAGPGDPRNLSLLWGHPIGSDASIRLVGVIADAEALYLAFNFRFAGSFLGRDLIETGFGHVVARLNKNDASIVWLKQYGSSSVSALSGIAIGGASQVFIAGGSKPSGLGDTPIGGIYYAALNAEDGSTSWVFGGGAAAARKLVLASDEAGNIYLAGEYSTGTVAGRLPMRQHVFVQSFDSAGTHRWTRFVSGPGMEFVYSLAAGAGRVAISGNVEDGADLGDGVPVTISRRQPFVTVLDASDGAHRWSRILVSDSSSGAVKGLTVDHLGRTYVGGSFETNLDVGGTVVTAADGEAFLAAYDAAGAHRWSRAFGDADGVNTVWSLATDADGNLYAGGEYSNSADFGGGEVTGLWRDGFALVYSADGMLLWARTFGGVERDDVSVLAVDPSGVLFFGGSSWGLLEFSEDLIVSDRGGDSYIAAFEPWLP